MRRRRIALGLVANLYDKLLLAGVQLAMVPLLVLHWGVQLYGCWVVMATLPGFLAIADLGFGGAAAVRVTALVARGERGRAAVVMRTAREVLAWGAGTLLVLVLLGIAAVPAEWLPSAPTLTPANARTVIAILALYATVILYGVVLGGGFASIGAAPLYALTNSKVALLENALLAAAAITGRGLVAGAAGLLAGRVIGTLVQRWLLGRRAGWLVARGTRSDPAERRLLAHSALSMFAVPLGQATALQGGVLALGAAAGPAATPAFAAARTLSRIALQATMLLTHALMPEFTAAHAQEDRPAQARMLMLVVGAALLAAVLAALAIAFAGDWLLAVWTKGAIVAPPGLMPAFSLVILLGGLWIPLSTLMLAINRQAAFAWAYLTLGAGAVALAWLLGGRLGAPGAALAMAALDACMCVVVGRFALDQWLRGLPVRAVAAALPGQLRALLARGGTKPAPPG